jgi:Zn-dependent M28 family amino/carboxypeptidase
MTTASRPAAWLALTAVICGSGCALPLVSRRTPAITVASVRAHMEMLSSDALQGRRSASRESWVAATYIASELRRVGVAPAGDAGGYLQPFTLPERAAMVGGTQASAAAGTTPGATTARQGWNVVGRLQGTDASETMILLGAHLDHIGVSGAGSDSIHNGADDNASGVAAVLGLAEALARGPRPRRTILFVFLDAEELGLFGGDVFLDRWTGPTSAIALALTFEMLGRPGTTVPKGTLWFTGYDRSNLGPELARRGARVVPDPYPAQKFFERSDNMAFARRGIVAHALSSYGLHRDYHTPADEMSRIDLDHLVDVTRMLVAPLREIADSTFVPSWVPGRQPPQRPR